MTCKFTDNGNCCLTDETASSIQCFGQPQDRQQCPLWSKSIPHIFLKPKLFLDGDMWCALYGEEIQSGLAAFGKTPAEAMLRFDKCYQTEIHETEQTENLS